MLFVTEESTNNLFKILIRKTSDFFVIQRSISISKVEIIVNTGIKSLTPNFLHFTPLKMFLKKKKNQNEKNYGKRRDNLE